MPSIGVGVFVVHPTRKLIHILLGQRGPQARRSPGMWALPGGMMEPGETVEECCRREVKEETGLIVGLLPRIDDYSPSVLGVSDHRPREDHMTLWVRATLLGGDEAKVLEPGKHLSWEWRNLDDLLKQEDLSDEQRYWMPLEAWAKFDNAIHHSKFEGRQVV